MNPASDSAPWQPPGSSTGTKQIALPLGNKASALGSDELTRLITAQCRRIPLQEWESQALLENCRRRQALDKGLAILYEYAGHMDRVKFLTERQSSLATDLENALLLTQTSREEIGVIFKSLVETNVAVILEIASWRRIQWCPSPVLVRPAGEDKNAKKLTIQSKLRKQVTQILPILQQHLPMLESSSPEHLAFFLAPCFTFAQAKSYFGSELKASLTIEQIFIAARNIFFLEDGVASTYRSFHPKGSSSSTISPYKSFPVLRLVYPGFAFPTEQFKWFWDADSVYQSSSEVLIHSVGQIGGKSLFHLGSSSNVQGSSMQTMGFLQQQQQQQQQQQEKDEQAALRFPESSLADVSYTMDHGVLSAPYFLLPDQLEAGSSVQVVSTAAALMYDDDVEVQNGPQSLTPPSSAATAKALAAKNKEEQELQQLEEELALAKLRAEEKRQQQLQLQQEEEALALSLAEEKQRLDNLLRLERERSAAKAKAEETLRRQKEEERAAVKAEAEERRAAAKAEAEEKQRQEKEERATAKAEKKKQEDEEKRRRTEEKKQQEDDKKRVAAVTAPSSKKASAKQSQSSSRPQPQHQQPQSENISRLEEEVALSKARAEEKLREEAALARSLAEEKKRLEEQEKQRQDSLLRLGAELAQTKARAEENLRLQREEKEALALSLAEEKQRLDNLLRLERERSAAKIQSEAQAKAEELSRRQKEEAELRAAVAARTKAASSAAVVAAAAAATAAAEPRPQSSPHHEHVSRKFVAALVQDGITSTVASRSRSVSPTDREPPASPSPVAPKHPRLAAAAAEEISTPFASSSIPDTPSSDPPPMRSSPLISKGKAVLKDSSFGTINLNLALTSRQTFSPKDILGAENKRWRALRCGSKKVAVVIIQTRMRMILAKKRMARKRESLNEERRHNKRVKALSDPTNKRANAAVMIQRHARGMWSRTRVFLLIKAAMVLNTAYRRNQSFVHLRRNLRRVERPLLITVRSLLNVPATVYNSSSTLRVKVSVYWSPMLHILHAAEVKQVIQGKFPQFTMTTAVSELKRVFTQEEQEARMRANMSRTSSMMFSLRSSSPREDAENEGNDDDDESSSSSEGDPEKEEEESASSKYRLYLKLPKITKSIKSVTSKLTRRFSSAIVPKVKRPTIPGTAKCMAVFGETIKVPSCHGNSAIKFEILNDANRRVTSAIFLLAQHGRLMFWEAEEKIPVPLGTMRRLVAGSDGNNQKMLEALDSPMLEVCVRSGAALRSKAGWGKLRIHGHGPIRAAIGASKDAQIVNFVWEVWNRFYFSLDGEVLGAYAGKNASEPIFTVECASITSCVSEKGEMIILEEGVARTSTDDSHNVFITIKNSIETLIFRFGDSGSRVQWVECLSKIVEDNDKTEAEEEAKAAGKAGQGSPSQRRGSNNLPASSEKAHSSSTKSISGDGHVGPPLQSPTSSSSSAASLQLPDLERQARQASRRSSNASPAGVKNMLPGVDSESLKALQTFHHKAQSFRSK